MKVMLLMHATRESEAGTPPDPAAILAMHEFNEELQKAGVLLDLGGLTPSSRGARIVFSRGGKKVVDGPFAESKELIAGYSVLEVRDLAEAIEWAKRAPVVLADGSEVVCELRPLYSAADFDPA